MIKLQHITFIFLIFPSISWGWGEPASATTTIEARVTNWTEDPCLYGDRFREACEYAKRYNLFPASQPTEPQGGWTMSPQPPSDLITNYE